MLKLLAAVNAVIFPLPDAGKPMEILELVQLNTVPNNGDPEKITGPVV